MQDPRPRSESKSEQSKALVSSLSAETELTLSFAHFFSFTARNCHQELSMIPLGGFRRLLNGELRYLGAPDGYKIQTKIRCQDRNIPAFHALRPGMPVDVGCVTTLTQPWQGPGVLTLDRPAVPGSVFVWNTKGAVAVESLSSQTLGLTELPNTSGDDEALRYVTYRPMLSMLLVSCRLSVDEWSVSSHWELELDER